MTSAATAWEGTVDDTHVSLTLFSSLAISRPPLASDGHYLYISARDGSGIAKVGTGLHGTVHGLTYVINTGEPVLPPIRFC